MDLENNISRREFGKGLMKFLLSGAILSTLSPFAPGCGGQKPTKLSLEEIATEQLIKKGELFHQYGNFEKINSIETFSENRYKVNVHFGKCFTSRNGFDETYKIEIVGTKMFLAHQDENFTKYILKHYIGLYGNQIKKKIMNKELKAVGSVIIKSEHGRSIISKKTEEITAFLEKTEENEYQWRFITKNRAPEHSILKAFELAYTKEKDKEFQQFK